LGTNEMYDPITNSWTYRTPMPIPCSGFAVAVFEDKIYCIGVGFNLVYDPTLDTWENKTIPIHRNSAQAHVLGEKIYVLGDYPNSSLNLVYDPLADSWSQRASLPEGFRWYSSGVYEGRLYVVGVYAEPSYWENNGLLANGRVAPMVQVYDPEKDEWSMVTRGDYLFYSGWPAFLLPTSGVYAPSELYFLYNPYGSHFDNIYYLVMFDWRSNNWDYKATGLNVWTNTVLYGGAFEYLPSERDGFAVVVLDDLIYVIGGWTIIGWEYTMGIPTMRISKESALVERYTPFGYGKVAPMVRVLSLAEGGEYSSEGVSLEFSLNRPVVWMGYSLDGAKNVTVGGNVSLSGLSEGVHFVQVFVEDEFGNVGVSDVLSFNVVVIEGEETNTFPVALAGLVGLVAILVTAVVLVVVGGVILLRRRHR